MKNGTLQKSGKSWRISYNDNKSIPVQGDFNLPDDAEGKSVEFDNSGGPVKRILLDGKEYTKVNVYVDRQEKRKGDKRHENKRGHQSSGQKKYARSPYNFIPLPLKPLYVQANDKAHHIFAGLSGRITIVAEAKTPVFIRSQKENEQFFMPSGTPMIPGSSMRGMVRHLVQIISQGKMDQYEDKTYYRRSNLQSDRDDIKAGFLQMNNQRFSIVPARWEKGGKVTSPNCYEYLANGTEACDFSTDEFQKRPKRYSFTLEKNGQSVDVSLDLIKSYESDKQRSEKVVDLVRSLREKKVVNGAGKEIGNISIPMGLGIPVFYRIDNSKQVISLGHARYHRIEMEYSTSQFIPDSHKEDRLDLGTSLFGSTAYGTRVFFEDLPCLNFDSNTYSNQKADVPNVLASPKPTSHLLYLQQGAHSGLANENTWSSRKDGLYIRGFKLYWHRHIDEHNAWKKPINTETTASHTHPIKPLPAGTTFKGVIRFENLSEEELGVLLFALDLPEGCCHKLGLGKPLGLGTVNINVKLTTIDRGRRYTELFDGENAFFTGEHMASTDEIKAYKNAFVGFLARHTGTEGKYPNFARYWEDDERMQELKKMLQLKHDFSHAQISQNDRTRYMEIERPPNKENEFKNSGVLPLPTKVMESSSYQTP